MKTAAEDVSFMVILNMQEELSKIAAHCTPAHQAALSKKKKGAKGKQKGLDKESAMRAPSAGMRNMLLGGALGLGAGLPAGAYAGYKREQNRLSPQEQAVVRQAMQQAYRQGNIAMYNKLRSMSQKPKKNTK